MNHGPKNPGLRPAGSHLQIEPLAIAVESGRAEVFDLLCSQLRHSAVPTFFPTPMLGKSGPHCMSLERVSALFLIFSKPCDTVCDPVGQGLGRPLLRQIFLNLHPVSLPVQGLAACSGEVQHAVTGQFRADGARATSAAASAARVDVGLRSDLQTRDLYAAILLSCAEGGIILVGLRSLLSRPARTTGC